MKCLSGHVPGGKPASKAQIMAAYKAQLREYRLLQEELGPWTQAFKAQHGRKPCLSDVERTGKGPFVCCSHQAFQAQHGRKPCFSDVERTVKCCCFLVAVMC